MQYSDDLGRIYFYNVTTAETTWEPPPGVEITPPPGHQQETAGDASEDGEELCKQQSFLLEEETKSPAVQLAEARQGMLAAMQGVEKRLHKARRGVEGGRPVEDVLSLLQQLQTSYDKMREMQTTFEGFANQRLGEQTQFMQSQGAYLSGLQSHMLGDEDQSSVASKVFKKAAYVADTLNRNKRAAL